MRCSIEANALVPTSFGPEARLAFLPDDGAIFFPFRCPLDYASLRVFTNFDSALRQPESASRAAAPLRAPFGPQSKKPSRFCKHAALAGHRERPLIVMAIHRGNYI